MLDLKPSSLLSLEFSYDQRGFHKKPQFAQPFAHQVPLLSVTNEK